jgi:hypothetical protein
VAAVWFLQGRRRWLLAAGKTPRNPACGFVDNSLAKTRQRSGALAVEKSQKTVTFPPRPPLTTSSTGASRFDAKCKEQNQKLIPLLELTYLPSPETALGAVNE